MKIQKLAAIYNVWDGIENLKGSIDLIEEHVDVFIIVGQTISNIGEQYDPWPEIHQAASGISKQVSYFNYFPDFKKNPSQNELEKRNIGLRLAKALRCSHFFSLDADEYHPRWDQYVQFKHFSKKKTGLLVLLKISLFHLYTLFQTI